MRWPRRTQQTGWRVYGSPCGQGEFISCREARKRYGLRPLDKPAPRRDTVRDWWIGQRIKWSRRLAP